MSKWSRYIAIAVAYYGLLQLAIWLLSYALYVPVMYYTGGTAFTTIEMNRGAWKITRWHATTSEGAVWSPDIGPFSLWIGSWSRSDLNGAAPAARDLFWPRFERVPHVGKPRNLPAGWVYSLPALRTIAPTLPPLLFIVRLYLRRTPKPANPTASGFEVEATRPRRG